MARVDRTGGYQRFRPSSTAVVPPSIRSMVRVIPIHSGPVILPELEKSLGVYAQEILAGRKVEIASRQRSKAFRAERFDFSTIAQLATIGRRTGVANNQ